MLSDEESAEDSAEGAVLAENYEAGSAADAPMPEMAADSVQSGPEAVEISPRVAAPPEPEGERVVDADDASAAELAPTLVPAPTQVLMEQVQVVTEEVALVQDDLQVAANKSPAVQEAPAQPAFSTGAIAVWFLGLLSFALIAATIIIRRKLD